MAVTKKVIFITILVVGSFSGLISTDGENDGGKGSGNYKKITFYMYLGIFGCIWVYFGVQECIWVYLDVYCLWVYLGVE